MGDNDDIDTKRICKDCDAEETLPGIDVGPICLDLLRKSDDDDGRARATAYEASLRGEQDPDLVVE